MMKKVYINNDFDKRFDKTVIDILNILGYSHENKDRNICSFEIYLKKDLKCKGDFSLEITLIFNEKSYTEKVYLKNVSYSDSTILIKKSILNLLNNIIKIPKLEWGILSGVRPVKLYHKLLKIGKNPNNILKEKYLLTNNKIKLLKEIVLLQKNIVNFESNELGVYIGVPYCPSKCIYCSFPVGIMPNSEDFQEKFCNAIEEDIHNVVQLISMFGLKLTTIYIGGGTPISLKEKYFDKMLDIVTSNLPMKHLDEFTVEAGRPDCFSEKKLISMKKHDVNRISLNPQSMNDSTLDIIGRKHTVKQIYDVYEQIRNYNIKCVNMDLIVGLPNETLEDVKYSIDKVVELNPENITIHTLTLKKGSRLFSEKENYKFMSVADAKEALNYARCKLFSLGMKPYYLYRQHYMLGNLENVGYSKRGYESIYNIQMMEEQNIIIGVGPSTATKIPMKDGHHLKKVYSSKDLKVYRENMSKFILKRYKIIEECCEREE